MLLPLLMLTLEGTAKEHVTENDEIVEGSRSFLLKVGLAVSCTTFSCLRTCGVALTEACPTEKTNNVVDGGWKEIREHLDVAGSRFWLSQKDDIQKESTSQEASTLVCWWKMRHSHWLNRLCFRRKCTSKLRLIILNYLLSLQMYKWHVYANIYRLFVI